MCHCAVLTTRMPKATIIIKDTFLSLGTLQKSQVPNTQLTQKDLIVLTHHQM